MKVTNVKFTWFNTEQGHTLALGRVTFDGLLTMNFSLMEGRFGYFINLGERKKGSNEKWFNTVTCETKAFYGEVTDAIVKAYELACDQAEQSLPA